jgi:hypothetical protein
VARKKPKKLKSLKKSNLLIQQRMKLLISSGFKYDEVNEVWSFEDQLIQHSIVKDLRLTFLSFEIMVSSIRPLVNQPAPYNWPTYRSSTKSDLPYLDAMDFRLPGSYGTGKRR